MARVHILASLISIRLLSHASLSLPPALLAVFLSFKTRTSVTRKNMNSTMYHVSKDGLELLLLLLPPLEGTGQA